MKKEGNVEEDKKVVSNIQKVVNIPNSKKQRIVLSAKIVNDVGSIIVKKSIIIEEHNDNNINNLINIDEIQITSNKIKNLEIIW